jgi:Acyl-CoA dehydrogenase, middle domain
MFQCNVVV